MELEVKDKNRTAEGEEMTTERGKKTDLNAI